MVALPWICQGVGPGEPPLEMDPHQQPPVIPQRNARGEIDDEGKGRQLKQGIEPQVAVKAEPAPGGM